MACTEYYCMNIGLVGPPDGSRVYLFLRACVVSENTKKLWGVSWEAEGHGGGKLYTWWRGLV